MNTDPLHGEDAEREALGHGLDFLNAYREGTLQFDGNLVPVKFVDDPSTGRLVISVPVAALLASDLLLFIPEEDDETMQLLVTAEEIKDCAATDRWMIYHGEPEHVRWAALWIDSAKLIPWVFDGDALTVPNPLEHAQGHLCRTANEQPDALRELCKRTNDMDVDDPRCVGVDPRGMHIRARFGIIRVPFDQVVEHDGDAAAMIESMLGTA